jgi:hypothetical protein
LHEQSWNKNKNFDLLQKVTNIPEVSQRPKKDAKSASSFVVS